MRTSPAPQDMPVGPIAKATCLIKCMQNVQKMGKLSTAELLANNELLY